MTEEREATAFFVWSKRGAAVGEAARLYCRNASPLAQTWMREAIVNHAGESKVTITCPK